MIELHYPRRFFVDSSAGDRSICRRSIRRAQFVAHSIRRHSIRRIYCM